MRTISLYFVRLFFNNIVTRFFFRIFFIFSICLYPTINFSQVVLQFPNGAGDGALVSGVAGTVGAIYQWANVGSEGGVTIKAKIEIISIIGSATLTTIDGASTAADWEPQVAGPITTVGNSWGMKFQVRFYNAANNAAYSITSLKAQAIDIDGGGGVSALREFNTFDNPVSYTLETPTDLTATDVGGNIKFKSGLAFFNGISIAQTQLIASCNYSNVNNVYITCGVVAVGGTVPAGNRLHSINFRNVVVFIDPITLPIDLTCFKAVKENNIDVDLKWTTASELNNDYFTIERFDQSLFIPLFIVNGAGNSNEMNEYHFLDAHPAREILYYRLKQTDYNGESSYSEIISVDNRIHKKEIDNITDVLGLEVNEYYKGVVIVVYTDGSTSKMIQ